MSKLNHILLNWLPGDIHGLSWLRERKVEQRLAYQYFEGAYLKKVGPGVFARKGDKVDWMGAVAFLQSELKFPLHVSGQTALELQGYGHYVSLGKKSNISLMSHKKKTFPKWLNSLNPSFKFTFNQSKLFDQEVGLTNFEERGFKIKISSRELAILELIDAADLTNSLETVENYMNALHTLRPNEVQFLLEKCNSIKTKRVFLYMAEKLSLKFVKELDKKKILLGTGKRVVVKGGELNKKYQITVDRSYGENPF